MNTFELTKLVGAVCGSLLVLLLIQFAADGIFDTSSEITAYLIEVPEAGGPGAETGAEEEQIDVAALMAAADPAKGEATFKRCGACHKLDGSNAVGPHLDGVIGRDIASVEGFGYSDALSGMEGAWDADKIFHFLESPKEYAPGTSMSFAGLPKPEDRANVIAYLESAGGG